MVRSLFSQSLHFPMLLPNPSLHPKCYSGLAHFRPRVSSNVRRQLHRRLVAGITTAAALRISRCAERAAYGSIGCAARLKAIASMLLRCT
jgi:hypothetical protein